MSLLLWEYGSMPSSLFLLEFELPNSDLYHLFITYSPSEISWSFNSSQIKWAKQKRRAEKYVENHTSVSSETVLSLLTPVTRQQTRGSFIYILLHHVQTKTLEKRAWLTSSSLDWWKVLLSCGSSQSARASELSTKWKWTKQSLCGQNQTSHAWQGRRGSWPSQGACHPPHPSLDTPTLWRTGLLTTGLKSGLGLSKEGQLYLAVQFCTAQEYFPNTNEGYWAVLCSPSSPTPSCLWILLPWRSPFQFGHVLV